MLKYKPWEFHRITFREVHLAIDGLYEQNKYYHDLLKLSTSLICLSGFNAKGAMAALRKGWPDDHKTEGSGKISERALAELRKLRTEEVIKKQSDGGRAEISS